MRIAFADFSGWDFHVVSVDSAPMGGSQSAACHLSRALTHLGHDVSFFGSVSAPGVYEGVNCLSWKQTDPSRLRALNLDAVVCILAAGRGAKLRTLLSPETRLVMWCQDAHMQQNPRPLEDVAERDAYDGFAMVSQWQLGHYQQHFSIDPAKMAILRNAIGPAFEGQFPADAGILQQKAQPPRLAYTSVPFRGLNVLLDAFPAIRKAVPAVQLQVFSSTKVYFASSGYDRNEYGHLYERCKQMEGVEYIGSLPQPQLAQAMRRVSVLAYPSTFMETSCIAAMEAMASGCRIVTTDLGALPETTAGFARLVPIVPDKDEFLRQFIEQTVSVLREIEQKPQETDDLLRRQVDQMNREAVWSVRAREWTKWLETLLGRGP